MTQPVLAGQRIWKTYSGIPVLRDVTLEVYPGEAVGLVGENGAGKSTLLNILSGVVQPDRGEVIVKGRKARLRSYNHANHLGIFRVFQESAHIPNLTVYENLLLSHESSFERYGVFLDRRRMRLAATQILRDAGLDIDVDRRVGDLRPAQRQALEIARATMLSVLLGIQRPTILLDEPTTALDASEERAVLRLVQRLKGEASFVFVSHRFDEVFEVSDRICVLKDGEVVASLQAERTTPEQLRRLMVGRERVIGDLWTDRGSTCSVKEPVLSARALRRRSALSGVSFVLHRSEILGVCGLEGSGKSDLGRALFGIVRLESGSVEWRGEPAQPGIAQMMARGVVYMPGDRQLEGLVLRASIGANITLASLHDRLSTTGGVIKVRLAGAMVDHWMKRLRITTRRPGVACELLSGGQQQKVMFAKFLSREPRVLVTENPTRGVDVSTKLEIYGFLRHLAQEGASILLISDDLPELIALSDRIMVLAHGQVIKTVHVSTDARPSEHDLIALMLASPRPCPTAGPGDAVALHRDPDGE